jgi:poly-gamma-glutamate synthesis protein (capsule biosynthesis protein)
MSLANNHIKDYGTEAILDTRRILRQHGIAFGGAGRDLAQARQISYLDVQDGRHHSVWTGQRLHPRAGGGTS